MVLRRAFVVIALAGGVGAQLAACSSGAGAPRAASNEATGQILTSLTAVGPDGATYSLPSSAFLLLQWTGGAGSGSSTLFFNNTTPTQSFTVATGTYSATLNGATSLVRSAGGGTSNVAATLTDGQPYAFTITGGEATGLTFHFVVQDIGDVTFSTGTLNTNLQVDAGTTSPSQAQVSGGAGVVSVLQGPPGLDSALSFMGTAPLYYSIAVTLTGPFQPSVDSACASATATITTPGMPFNSLQQNIDAFAQEASGGVGSFCVFDGNPSSSFPGQIVFYVDRTGAPQTPQMIAALGGTSAGASQDFLFQIQGQPASPLFDGTTASLSQLSQPLTVPVVDLLVDYEPNNTFLSATMGQGVPGSATFQLLPGMPGSGCAAGAKLCSATGTCIPGTACCTGSDCTASGEACSGPGGQCSCTNGGKVCAATNSCIASGTCCNSADCPMGQSCPGPGAVCL
jgi:hypothetical protein